MNFTSQLLALKNKWVWISGGLKTLEEKIDTVIYQIGSSKSPQQYSLLPPVIVTTTYDDLHISRHAEHSAGLVTRQNLPRNYRNKIRQFYKNCDRMPLPLASYPLVHTDTLARPNKHTHLQHQHLINLHPATQRQISWLLFLAPYLVFGIDFRSCCMWQSWFGIAIKTLGSLPLIIKTISWILLSKHLWCLTVRWQKDQKNTVLVLKYTIFVFMNGLWMLIDMFWEVCEKVASVFTKTFDKCCFF